MTEFLEVETDYDFAKGGDGRWNDTCELGY